MSILSLLQEKHNFSIFDEVEVSLRDSPNKYKGIIHLILKEEYFYNNYEKFDHFYIRFPVEIVDTIIKKGWNIIYEGRKIIVGDVIRSEETGKIEKVYAQQPFPSNYQYEIKMDKIDSILISRIGWKIWKKQ